MGSKRGIAGDVAAKYVRENPDVPSKSLARELFAKEPKLYPSLNAAYCQVRKLRGNIGNASRKYTRDKSNYRPNGKSGEVLLPKGLRQGKKPIQIDGPCKILVLSDLHVPYHDETAIEAALRKGIDEGCDGLYLNGDTCDFYALSRWQKDPRERNFKRELTTAREMLVELGRHFERKWFKCGNHDERWELYLFNRAEDLAELEEFSLPELLRLQENKYEYVASKQRAMFGELPCLHGHELVAGLTSPVNPARGLWLRLTSTAMCGHSHRSSQHSEVHAITKKLVSCWSTGCLCDREPDYSPYNKWNLGFAIVSVDAGNKFNLDNYQFDDGMIFKA